MKTNKYCIYCRKAAVQDESSVSSINNQKETLEKYATDNKLDVVGTYIDNGLEYPNRNIMLEAIKNKQANCIIVMDWSRLSRNISTGKQIIDMLDGGEIDEIKTPYRTYLNDAYSKALLTIEFYGFEYDARKEMSKRIKMGMAAAKLRKSQN